MIGGKIGWVDGEMRGKVGGRGGSSHFTLTLISPIAFSLVGDGGEDLVGGKVGARGGGGVPLRGEKIG